MSGLNEIDMITEGDITLQIRRRVEEPIRLFTASDIGIDFPALAAAMESSWKTLPWDYYDVRRRHCDIIADVIALGNSRTEEALDEYYEHGDRESLRDVLPRLPEGIIAELEAVQPFRRRAIAFYVATPNAGCWNLDPKPVHPFSMPVVDYRKIPRKFAQLDETVLTNVQFRALIIATLDFVRDLRPHASHVDVFAHQVSTVARPHYSGTNSPEGIHQDGADFIVSAFMVARHGVLGGESRLYIADESEPFYSHVLQPGEGIFQVDKGSQLFHHVTPINCGLSDPEEVHRDIIGLDFHIREYAT